MNTLGHSRHGNYGNTPQISRTGASLYDAA